MIQILPKNLWNYSYTQKLSNSYHKWIKNYTSYSFRICSSLGGLCTNTRFRICSSLGGPCTNTRFRICSSLGGLCNNTRGTCFCSFITYIVISEMFQFGNLQYTCIVTSTSIVGLRVHFGGQLMLTLEFSKGLCTPVAV